MITTAIDNDLLAFLRGWAETPCPVSWRAAFCDWIDTRTDFHRMQLWDGRLPAKWGLYFRQHGKKLPWWAAYRRSTRKTVAAWFDNYRVSGKHPFRGWGEGRVGGLPVVIASPSRRNFDPETLAAHLSDLIPCPITYDFGSEFPWEFRIAIWFWFARPQPQEAGSSENPSTSV